MSIQSDIDDDEIRYCYSDKEWENILEALPQANASAESIKTLRLRLLLPLNSTVIGDDVMIAGYEATKQEYQDALDGIELLERSLGHHIIGEDEFAFERDDLGEDYGAVRLQLQRLKAKLGHLVRLQDRNLAMFPLRPRASNNSRPFARRLMRAAADEWVRLGGTIDHGIQFKTFFTAVVHPVLSDAEVIRKTKCAWSDGLFRNFVQDEMKRRGLSGKRGPKAKTQR